MNSKDIKWNYKGESYNDYLDRIYGYYSCKVAADRDETFENLMLENMSNEFLHNLRFLAMNDK